MPNPQNFSPAAGIATVYKTILIIISNKRAQIEILMSLLFMNTLPKNLQKLDDNFLVSFAP